MLKLFLGPIWRDKLLESGDVILKVAQKNETPVEISGMRLDDAIKMIKGPSGTQVYLTVKRIDGTVEVVEITRDVVELEEVYARSSSSKREIKPMALLRCLSFMSILPTIRNAMQLLMLKKNYNS